MSASPGISRISLFWLLVAQTLAIMPHIIHLPPWLAALWLGCTLWRIQILRMRANYPPRWVRVGLILLVALGVFISRGTLVGLEGGVLLLIAAFLLKLLEMRTRRDALVVIFLGFFVVLTAYLFAASIAMASFSLLPICALLAALIGLQQSSIATRPWPTLRLAGSLLLQALPLTLLLFVFFPRLAPLWALPVATERSALTGLSDSMAVADITELGRSTALAFRATFSDSVPPRSQLYWRGLTFDLFDGQRWSQSVMNKHYLPADWQPSGQPLRYGIVMQPSSRPWVFALDVGVTDQSDIRQMGDFRLQRNHPVNRTLFYNVTSWPQAVREPQLASPMFWLRLPAQGNQRARDWAQSLRQQHAEDEQLVQAVLEHFNRQAYVYTLRPPVLGGDSVDAFLFDTRSGFCAHYAGAMTFVLRAAGIPSRVVAGYQGGEINEQANYVQVRQFDAHAWVEYWLPSKGWQSVDPTFQVAPERVEQGLEQALAKEDSFLENSPLSPLRYRNIAWINNMRLAWDELDYNWQIWILGYQGDQQLQLLQRWFGQVSSMQIALLLAGMGTLLLFLLSLWLFKPWQRSRDPLPQLYQRFERLLARRGLYRAVGEGARDFALRAITALPSQAPAIEAFSKGYEQQRYGENGVNIPLLRRQLRNLAKQLP